MSQIEQGFRELLSKKPEIEKCYIDGLINRRALARYLVRTDIVKENQVEAAIAMLRRFEFKKPDAKTEIMFHGSTISLKDNIVILTLDKDQNLLKSFDKLLIKTNYSKGETLKIVTGTSYITLIADQKNKEKINEVIGDVKPKKYLKNISEISMVFPDNAMDSKGIISFLSKELFLNDIVISEFLTASSEILVYVKEDYVLKAYEVLKRMQKKNCAAI